jgi:hypothetical protein
MEADLLRRLEELRAERTVGNRRLEQLSREFEDVRETMLRISGAIQVLKELLAVDSPDPVTTDAAVPTG